MQPDDPGVDPEPRKSWATTPDWIKTVLIGGLVVALLAGAFL